MKRILTYLFLVILSYSGLSQSNELDDYIIESLIDSNGQEIVGVMVPGKPPDKFRMPVAPATKGSTILSVFLEA